MKSSYLAVILLIVLSRMQAQLPHAYLKNKQALALGAQARTAPLVVVIENEKNADDAALVSAVKEYWSAGTVKYMSDLEFSEKLKSGSLDPANLYLFNNFKKNYYTALSSVKIMFNPSKIASYPAFYPGFYLTNDPARLLTSTKNKNAPPYLHFSANALYDKRREPIKGYYALMIKNFDHDIKYCQDEANFKKRKKIRQHKGVSVLINDSLSNKTILLVKEQTSKQEKKSKKNEGRESNKKKKKNYIEENFGKIKEPVIVFPEDIEYAVKKSDPNIMLYTGGTLYLAKDGSVIATRRIKKSSPLPVIYSCLSIAATAALIILVF